MNWIHSFLDRSPVDTWRYEKRVRVALETLLLIACAAPVVTGWRSFIAQLVVGALRLHQAEMAREKASIWSRPTLMSTPPVLIFSKRQRISELEKRDQIISWTWPVFVPMVQAAETRAFGVAVALGIVATLVRVWFDRWAMPMWRKSRVEWRREQLRKQCAGIVSAVMEFKSKKEDWTW